MGWLNTVLDVASIGLDIATLSQLHQLRQQGEMSAAVQGILQELRNQIFNYNQAAQAILQAELREPVTAAGAMRVLELRLDDSGIVPDVFFELSDKQYVADTYRYIKGQSARMYALLNPADQQAVVRMAAAADHLPEVGYYVESYDDLQRYKEARAKMDSAPMFANQWSVMSMGCGAPLVLLFIGGLISVASNSSGTLAFMMIVGLAAGFGLIFYSRPFLNAKRLVGELEKKLDLPKLMQMDREFNGDKGTAVRVFNQANNEIRTFFGNSYLLPPI